MMTIRERLEAFWAGERPDRIPYSIYYWEWQRAGDPADWRPMFDAGLGVTRHVATSRDQTSGVETEVQHEQHEGHELRRVIRKTPVGQIQAEWLDGWNHTFWLKTAEDYRVMTWIVEHTEVLPNPEEWRQREAEAEPWEVLLAYYGRTPMQHIIVDYVGLENYGWHCFELAEPMMELYEALRRNALRRAEIVAEGPGRYVAVLENFTAETMGPRRYDAWLRPVYDAIVPMLQAGGKVVGTHYDGQLKSCAAEVAASPQDIIESFTPPPEGDLTLAEGRAAFAPKRLWSNLNIALYQLPPAELRQEVLERVAQGAPDGAGLAFEVSEHWPRNWRESMPVVLAALAETAR